MAGKMIKLHQIASVLGSTVLSAIAMPAIAQTTQVSTQDAVINGNNNQIIQVINQVSIGHPSRSSRNQERLVQDTLQTVNVDGSGNVVVQESTQRNESVSRRSGGRNQHPVNSTSRREHDDDDDDKKSHGRNHDRDHDDDNDNDDDD